MLLALIAMMILAAPVRAGAAKLPAQTLHVGGADIEVSFAEATFPVTSIGMLDWITKSANAVTEYYGHFPVQHLRVNVVPIDRGKGVVFGRTFVPGPVPVIRVFIGAVASMDDLREDWVMTHEM